MSDANPVCSYLSPKEITVINKLICEADHTTNLELDSYLDTHFDRILSEIKEDYNKKPFIIQKILSDFFKNVLGFKKCKKKDSVKRAGYGSGSSATSSATSSAGDATHTVDDDYELLTCEIFSSKKFFSLNTHVFEGNSYVKQHIFSICGIDPHITLEFLRSGLIKQIDEEKERRKIYENLTKEISSLQSNPGANKITLEKRRKELEEIKNENKKLQKIRKSIPLNDKNSVIARSHITYIDCPGNKQKTLVSSHIHLRNNLHSEPTTNGKWNNLLNDELLNLNSSSIKILELFIKILNKIYSRIEPGIELFDKEAISNKYILTNNTIMPTRTVDLRWSSYIFSCLGEEYIANTASSSTQSIITKKKNLSPRSDHNLRARNKLTNLTAPRKPRSESFSLFSMGEIDVQSIGTIEKTDVSSFSLQESVGKNETGKSIEAGETGKSIETGETGKSGATGKSGEIAETGKSLPIIARYENINVGDKLIIREEFETGSSMKQTKREAGTTCTISLKKEDDKKVFALFANSRIGIDITKPLNEGKFILADGKKSTDSSYKKKYLKYKNKYLQLKTKNMQNI
jgi:hypothetical protein